MGNRIDAKNLKVYFIEGVTKEEAIDFTKYWRDNGFVGEKEQVIRLDLYDNETIVVKLIEKELYHADPLTISEEALLQDIERDLNTYVFKRPAIIQIVDNTFRPIEKVNSKVN